MEPFDLELAELDVESANEVLKDIATFIQQLGRLLVRQDLLYVLIWSLKVWKQQNEHFHLVSRYLYQVDLPVDVMEVTV